MLYKFINENEIQQYNGGFVVLDNRIYTNPTEEVIKNAGYKELVETERPSVDPEKEFLSFKYQDGDVIKKVWSVKELPDIEE